MGPLASYLVSPCLRSFVACRPETVMWALQRAERTTLTHAKPFTGSGSRPRKHTLLLAAPQRVSAAPRGLPSNSSRAFDSICLCSVRRPRAAIGPSSESVLRPTSGPHASRARPAGLHPALTWALQWRRILVLAVGFLFYKVGLILPNPSFLRLRTSVILCRCERWLENTVSILKY